MPEIICRLWVNAIPSPTLLEVAFPEKELPLCFPLFPLQIVFKQVLGNPSICQLEKKAKGPAEVMTAQKQLPSYKIIAFTKLE